MSGDMDGLIARLEAASEGSRELDIEIAALSGYEHMWDTAGDDAFVAKVKEPGDTRPRVCDLCPRYTRSLDAALTLLPEGCGWACDTRPGETSGHRTLPRAWVSRFDDGHCFPDIAATIELALCIACLRARQHSERTEKPE